MNSSPSLRVSSSGNVNSESAQEPACELCSSSEEMDPPSAEAAVAAWMAAVFRVVFEFFEPVRARSKEETLMVTSLVIWQVAYEDMDIACATAARGVPVLLPRVVTVTVSDEASKVLAMALSLQLVTKLGSLVSKDAYDEAYSGVTCTV